MDRSHYSKLLEGSVVPPRWGVAAAPKKGGAMVPWRAHAAERRGAMEESCRCVIKWSSGIGEMEQGGSGEVHRPRLHHWLCPVGLRQHELSFSFDCINLAPESSMAVDAVDQDKCNMQVPLMSESVEVVLHSMPIDGAGKDCDKIKLPVITNLDGYENASEEALAIYEAMHVHLGGCHDDFIAHSIGSAPTQDPNDSATTQDPNGSASTEDEDWNNWVIDHTSTYYIPEYRDCAKRGSK